MKVRKTATIGVIGSDLFAFGAVLYEMLTGRRAFEGETESRVIAAVLDSEPPPITGSQPLTPPALEHVVKRCLAKNPDERWQTMHDVRLQLTWVAESTATVLLVERDRKSTSRRAWMLGAGTAGLILGVVTASFVLFLVDRRAEKAIKCSRSSGKCHRANGCGRAPT